MYIHRCRFDPQSKLLRIQSSLKYINAAIPSDPTTQAVVDKWVSKVDQTLRSNGYQPELKLADLKETLECKESDIRSRQTLQEHNIVLYEEAYNIDERLD